MKHTITLVALGLLATACSDSSRPPLNAAPVISAVGDITLEANTTAPVNVTLSDDVTAIGELGFTTSNNNNLLLPEGSIVTALAASGRTVTVMPAPGVLGVATITLTVTDERGASDTAMFELTVTPQSVAFDTVLRSVFSDDANDSPRELGSLDIQEGDGNADLSDLL